MSTKPTQEITEDKLDKMYSALFDSKMEIDSAVDGIDHYQSESMEYRTDSVKRNVEHLVYMVSRDIWGTRELNEINLVISKGNTFLGN